MPGNQPGKRLGEPLNMGLSIFAPISSVAGSSSLLFGQPLLTGDVVASTALLIGSELFLFIANVAYRASSIFTVDGKWNRDFSKSTNGWRKWEYTFKSESKDNREHRLFNG